MTTRSSATKELFGSVYTEVYEYKPTANLPPGKIVIGRMLALCKLNKGQRCMSRDEAIKVAANALRMDWINKNTYPMAIKYRLNLPSHLLLRPFQRNLSFLGKRHDVG